MMAPATEKVANLLAFGQTRCQRQTPPRSSLALPCFGRPLQMLPLLCWVVQSKGASAKCWWSQVLAASHSFLAEYGSKAGWFTDSEQLVPFIGQQPVRLWTNYIHGRCWSPLAETNSILISKATDISSCKPSACKEHNPHWSNHSPGGTRSDCAHVVLSFYHCIITGHWHTGTCYQKKANIFTFSGIFVLPSFRRTRCQI